jgi:hypothetical protein
VGRQTREAADGVSAEQGTQKGNGWGLTSKQGQGQGQVNGGKYRNACKPLSPTLLVVDPQDSVVTSSTTCEFLRVC